jgi:hypothetical protein
MKKTLMVSYNIPSPHDAIARGEEMIFLVTKEISFRVTSSTSFKKLSMGFLQFYEAQLLRLTGKERN